MEARSSCAPLRSALVALALASLALSLQPASAQEPGHEIEACLRKNVPAKSSVQTVKFEATDRVGHTRSLEGKVYWKRYAGDLSRSLIRLQSPPDVDGSMYLMVERKGGVDVFVYLPEYRKVRRITPHAMSGSLFGTDFTYEDMRHLRHLARNSDSIRLPDSVWNDRPVYHLQFLPPEGEDSEYEYVIAWIDQERCLPMRLQFFESGDTLTKELTVDPASIRQEGSIWVAESLTMRDLQEKTETRLEFSDLEVDGDLPDRLFSEKTLERGR